MTNLGIVLDYEIRKAVYMFSSDKEYGKDELIMKFTQIIEEYVNTEEGKTFFKENDGVITLHDFMQIKKNIPSDIFRKFGIVPDYCPSGNVIVLNAFQRLIDKTPIMAVFGIYDEDCQINNYDMKHLIDSVNWLNQHYIFRPLMVCKRCVGFGFIAEDMVEEDSFVLDDFMNYVVEIADKKFSYDDKIYEYKGIGVKMVPLNR